MPDNEKRAHNGEILKVVLDIQKTVGDMSGDVKAVKTLTTKHEKVLYGTPEKFGKDGLIAHQADQDEKIRSAKRELGYIVAGVGATITVVFNFIVIWFKSWFAKSS